jgi:hypothetical protein
MSYKILSPLPIVEGGTGVQSATAYAVICGGTTSTAHVQSIASVGTAGQVLTSNGAGALPTFQNGVNFVAYTNVNTSPYVVLSTDEYLSVDSSGGAITIQLPNAATLSRILDIKDRTGSAATHNITVTTVGGAVNIDGATTFVMNTAYQSISVIGNASTYEVF